MAFFKGCFTLACFTLENRNPSSSLFSVLFPLQLLLHNAEEKAKPSLLMSCYIFLPFLGEFSFTSCWNTKGLIFISCNPVKAIPVIHIYTCAGLFLTPGFHLWDSYQIWLRWCWGSCLFALVLSPPCFQQRTHQDRELEMSCGSQTPKWSFLDLIVKFQSGLLEPLYSDQWFISQLRQHLGLKWKFWVNSRDASRKDWCQLCPCCISGQPWPPVVLSLPFYLHRAVKTRTKQRWRAWGTRSLKVNTD